MATDVNDQVANSTSWLDIIAPEDCDRVIILNKSTTVALKIRTNPDLASTESSLLPGVQRQIGGPYRHGVNAYRFPIGSRICSVQAVSGTVAFDQYFD